MAGFLVHGTVWLIFALSITQQQKKPLQDDFQSNMDRLLGAQERSRAPEAKPATQTKDGSSRGVQHEEFSDADPLSTPSVLGPALAAEMESRRATMAELHTGGPDPTAIGRTRTMPSATAKRSSLQVVNVSGDSYKGAGTVEKNIKRAAKRELKRNNRDPATGKKKATVKGTTVVDAKTKVTFKGTPERPEVRSTQPDGNPEPTPDAAEKVAPNLDTKLE